MKQDMREQKAKPQAKKRNYKIIPTSWYESTTLILCHTPIIDNNNTMDTEFLVQMRQSNKCGSVRNDEIFNLHLGSGAGPWVSIPCLLQDTSHIYWFHPPNQIARKNKEPRNEIQLPTNGIVLPSSTYTEPRAKRGRLGTQP